MPQTDSKPPLVGLLVGGLVLALIVILFAGLIIRAAVWAF